MLRNPRADKSKQKRTDGSPRLPAVCAGVQSRLTRYLDGELNARERERLQAHLDTCASCREELRLFASSERMLAGARETVPSPGDLRAGFYARLHAAPAQSRTTINWRMAAPAFAACGLLAAFGASSYFFNSRLYPATPGMSVSQSTSQRDTALRSQARPQIALGAQKRAPAYGLPAVPRSVTQSRASTPRKNTAALASAGIHNETSGFAAAKARAWSLASGQAQSAPRSPRRRRADGSAHSIAAARLPVSSNLLLSRRKSVGLQVARLGLSERETHGVGDEEAGTEALGESRKFGFGAAAKPRQDGNSLAYRPQTFGRESLAERAKSGDAVYLYDAHAAEKTRQEAANVLLRTETFALAAPRGEENDRAGAGFGEAVGGADGVSFQVRDTRRGFVAGTRAASEVQRREGRQVLSIRMEDDDARTPETENTSGETSGKTGNQE